jgi:hypothetical protein
LTGVTALAIKSDIRGHLVPVEMTRYTFVGTFPVVVDVGTVVVSELDDFLAEIGGNNETIVIWVFVIEKTVDDFVTRDCGAKVFRNSRRWRFVVEKMIKREGIIKILFDFVESGVEFLF